MTDIAKIKGTYQLHENEGITVTFDFHEGIVCHVNYFCKKPIVPKHNHPLDQHVWTLGDPDLIHHHGIEDPDLGRSLFYQFLSDDCVNTTTISELLAACEIYEQVQML